MTARVLRLRCVRAAGHLEARDAQGPEERSEPRTCTIVVRCVKSWTPGRRVFVRERRSSARLRYAWGAVLLGKYDKVLHASLAVARGERLVVYVVIGST